MRIWITRTAPHAEDTAARLRALGHAPLVAPVLEVRRLAAPPPDLAGVGALAFTSRNGVAAFAALTSVRGLPVVAVGDATARAAREAGFADVRSADGDVDALAAYIRGHPGELSGELLHPGASEPAGDLAAALREAGITVRLHPVYATEAWALSLAAAAALKARPVELDAVLVHSPRAAERLAQMEEVMAAAQHLHAYCISPAAAAPLARLGFASVAVAAEPHESALLSLFAR